MKKYSVRKYIVTTVFAASLVFTPILGGSAFAYGGPEAGGTEENGTVQEQPKQKQNIQTEKKETSNTAVDSGLLVQGDRGEAVEGLQNSLGEKGYHTAADGIFGADTEAKVKTFQGDQGLAVDGIAGPATINALNGAAPADGEEVQITEVVESSSQGNSNNEQAEVHTNSPEDVSIQATTVQKDSPVSGDVTAVAQSLVGSPYEFGGTTPAGFDSSGFINYAFSQVGVSLDRTHAGMWANNGFKVDSPAVGDVVFFSNTYQGGVSHSGIYIGNGEMIHAGTEETGVEVTSMEYDYWESRYIGAKRFN